ncbi:glycoside hydrolase [Mucidula mucida]|nr:glycoside hydrolase [Mucidula mucida]
MLTLFLQFLIPSARAATVSSTPAQTFTGVGGSGAWWPMDLYNFPEATRQNLSDLLFNSSGLGLSSYRWNVGSGGVNVSNPVRAPETFYVAPGQYDWDKDKQGVYFLKAASDRGVKDLTMFANSAPAPLTQDRTSCNSYFVNGSGAAYGRFLADVVEHFIHEGISINYISPMNEPDSTFGPSPCGQKGMQVNPNQRAEVVSTLYDALSAKGLQTTVGILADESSSLSRASSEYSSWLPQVIDKVAALVHHTYDFPSDASYRSYVNTTKTQYPSKVTWMSEVCCSLGQANGTGRGWSQGYDPTITNALMFSGMMFQSFLVAGEPHYDYWTLLSNGLGCSPQGNSACATTPNSNGWNDGVIYYDGNYATNGNYALYITKHFWTFKHFSNFVTPGSKLLPITGTGFNSAWTMAVISSDSRTYRVLTMNPNASDDTISLSFSASVCASDAFRTSASEDFAAISPATSVSGSWTLPLKSMSLSTYSFSVC